MIKLNRYYNEIKFSIKIFFFASFLIFLGKILHFFYLQNFFYLSDYDFFIKLLINIFIFFGCIILYFFPIFIFIIFLNYKKYKDNNIILTSILSYSLFLLILFLLNNKNSDFFLNFNFQKNKFFFLNTGSIGVFCVFLLINFIYKKNKKKYILISDSIINFEDKKLIYCILGTFFISIIFYFISQFFFFLIFFIIKYFASDKNNPVSFFIYNLLDRFFSLLNIQNILHKEILYGEFGGSYVTLSNKIIFGDLNIWNAQINDSLNNFNLIINSGYYTTIYYLLNFFAIPGYIISIFFIISNKYIKKKLFLFLIILIIISFVSGVLLPVELFMFFTSPLLYFFHIFISSIFFVFLRCFFVNIGFENIKNPFFLIHGGIFDIYKLFFNSVFMKYNGIKFFYFFLIGIFMFLIYFKVTKYYYNKMALDPLDLGIIDKKKIINCYINSLGGIKNIKSITNSIMSLYINLYNKNLIKIENLHKLGVIKIIKTKLGYVLVLNNCAFFIQKKINLLLKKKKK